MGVSRTIGFRRVLVSVPNAGTPVAISPDRLFVTDFELYVVAANPGAAMFIGDINVDSTYIPRLKGTTTNFTHGTGEFIGEHAVIGFDLSKIYLDGSANGDRAIVQYFAGDQ